MIPDTVLHYLGFVLAGFLAVAWAYRPDLTLGAVVVYSVAGSSLWAITLRLLRSRP